MTTLQLQTNALLQALYNITDCAVSLVSHRLYTGDLEPSITTPQTKIALALSQRAAMFLNDSFRQFLDPTLLSPTSVDYIQYSYIVNATPSTNSPQPKLITTNSQLTDLDRHYQNQLNLPNLPPNCHLEPIDKELEELCNQYKLIAEKKCDILQTKIDYIRQLISQHYDDQLIQAVTQLELCMVSSREEISHYEGVLRSNQQIVMNTVTTSPTSVDNDGATLYNQLKIIKRRRFQKYLPPSGSLIASYANSTSSKDNMENQIVSLQPQLPTNPNSLYYKKRKHVIMQLLYKIFYLKSALSFSVFRTNVLINKIIFNATSVQNILKSLQMIVTRYNHSSIGDNTHMSGGLSSYRHNHPKSL